MCETLFVENVPSKRNSRLFGRFQKVHFRFWWFATRVTFRSCAHVLCLRELNYEVNKNPTWADPSCRMDPCKTFSVGSNDWPIENQCPGPSTKSLALRLFPPLSLSRALPFPIVTRMIALHSAVNIAPDPREHEGGRKNCHRFATWRELGSLAARSQRK